MSKPSISIVGSMRVLAVACTALVLLLTKANADEYRDWSSQGKVCEKDEPNFGWCQSLLRKDGWELKHLSESPENIVDVLWRLEVWVRNQSALVCEYRGGRGGIRVQGGLEAPAVAP